MDRRPPYVKPLTTFDFPLTFLKIGFIWKHFMTGTMRMQACKPGRTQQGFGTRVERMSLPPSFGTRVERMCLCPLVGLYKIKRLTKQSCMG